MISTKSCCWLKRLYNNNSFQWGMVLLWYAWLWRTIHSQQTLLSNHIGNGFHSICIQSTPSQLELEVLAWIMSWIWVFIVFLEWRKKGQRVLSRTYAQRVRNSMSEVGRHIVIWWRQRRRRKEGMQCYCLVIYVGCLIRYCFAVMRRLQFRSVLSFIGQEYYQV